MAANQVADADIPDLSSSDTRDGPTPEGEDGTAGTNSRSGSIPPVLSPDQNTPTDAASAFGMENGLDVGEDDVDALYDDDSVPPQQFEELHESDGEEAEDIMSEPREHSEPPPTSSSPPPPAEDQTAPPSLSAETLQHSDSLTNSAQIPTTSELSEHPRLEEEVQNAQMTSSGNDSVPMETIAQHATEKTDIVEQNTLSTPSKMKKKEAEVIDLINDSTDGENVTKQKPNKSLSPIPDDPDVTIVQEKPRPPVSAQSLLNRIEATVLLFARADGENSQRKLVDVMMQALNQEVQRDPAGVQRVLGDKELRLPTSVSVPPSQVVDLIVEHEPEVSLRRVLGRLFGDMKVKITDNERKEREMLRQTTPAPHMTRLMLSIGQDLVQEATYSDIVHARNLPEAPRNEATYKQVAAQLRPVLEALRQKNEPYKTKVHRCHLCAFRTDSLLVLAQHKHMPHHDGRKYHCALCPEYDTNERRIKQHYLQEHGVIATEEDPGPKAPCPCCTEDFPYKGMRDMHLKNCRRDLVRARRLLAPGPDDVATVSRWLWEKPPAPLVHHPFGVQVPPVRGGQMPYPQGLRLMSLAPQVPGSSTQRVVVPMTGAHIAPRPNSNRLLLPQPAQQTLQAALQQQQQAINAAAQQQRLQQLVVSQRQRNNAVPMPNAPGINAYTPRFTGRPPNPNKFANTVRAPAKSLAEALNQPILDQHNRHIPTALYPQQARPAQVPMEQICEICDQAVQDRDKYLAHLQLFHKQMQRRTAADMLQGAPLACSRCRERFWTYEGLERHLVMAHGLVTSELLAKAQKKEDGGRCKICSKQYAFNMLQHLVTDHQSKLCSAEIMYSCDVCAFKCAGYAALEEHLATVHPKNPFQSSPAPVPAPVQNTPTMRQAPPQQNDEQQRPGPSGQLTLQQRLNQLAAQPPPTNQLKRPMTSTPSSAPPAKRPGKARVKYTCTPCDLRFEVYSEVIAHWQQSHLKKAEVRLCRVDCCPVHREEMLENYDCKFVFPEPTEPGPGNTNESIITLD